MRYVSTRGEAPDLGFEDVLLAGLARDGGLYVPERWPRPVWDDPARLAALAGMSYADAAFEVMSPFAGAEMGEADLRACLRDAYAGFGHPAVAPLVQTGPATWILELFHGPTLAFKDIAMQALARLMDRVLAKRSRRATIVAATSGDTGGAAAEAFRGREAIDLFVLFPEGRVSEAQRRQMTTAPDANVHAAAVRGTFDDCQALVKGLFNDLAFRDRLALAAVNSINWARILAQTVYYVTAAAALGAPWRRPCFVVPTGNFGNAFAGYAAARTGLPVSRLVIATNVNDILARVARTGVYEPRGAAATRSPAMDIEVSSNFERLVFELCGRASGRVAALMEQLQTKGGFVLDSREQAALGAAFLAGSASEEEAAAATRRLYEETGYLADPHTAVAVAVAEKLGIRGTGAAPAVILATAHPAKFPEAACEAVGQSPAVPAPIRRQSALAERVTVLDNSLAAVRAFIEARARAVRWSAA